MMKLWKYSLSTLLLITVAVWLGVYSFPDNKLHLIACDVGQGDAILVLSGNNQILVDGGVDNKVINCLSKHLPFWDREIEMIVSTHPDKDHFGGLIEVVRRYKVNAWLKGEGQSSSLGYEVLEKEVGGRGIRVLEASDVGKYRLGLIYLDVLNEFGDASKSTTNENSLVTLLKYGNFKAILTGDAETKDLIKMVNDRGIDLVNYLKVSHHGSKSGTSLELLDLLQPEIAVISVGKNSYGHPTKEVLGFLEQKQIKYLRTDYSGDIEIITDGEKIWTKSK